MAVRARTGVVPCRYISENEHPPLRLVGEKPGIALLVPLSTPALRACRVPPCRGAFGRSVGSYLLKKKQRNQGATHHTRASSRRWKPRSEEYRDRTVAQLIVARAPPGRLSGERFIGLLARDFKRPIQATAVDVYWSTRKRIRAARSSPSVASSWRSSLDFSALDCGRLAPSICSPRRRVVCATLLRRSGLASEQPRPCTKIGS